MIGATLPAWFWAVYYFFFLTTFGTAAWSIGMKKHKWLPIIAILFTVTIPAVGMMNSIGRADEMNEFDYLIRQLQQGARWSLYSVIGYFFLAGWLFFFVFNSIKRLRRAGRSGIEYDGGE
ncbi:hypothetical protein [Rossellomorea aquimaris]|uniref:Uncharacterized protein n=1 Tax=Rossellomorea aquimaris TaxID=189382 RepID=A0A1J6WLN0_9BACI|nr:hypothetical protein [Rossellomorea aquimaris]OIU72720.1 hypothetical protein BHE18_15125 [Rossellomorea aquimaris]